MSLESRFGIYESRKAVIATLMQLPFGSQKERIDCYLSANKALKTLQICLKALFSGEIPTFARKVCAAKVLHASGTLGDMRRRLQVVHACTFNASRVNHEANNPPAAYSYRDRAFASASCFLSGAREKTWMACMACYIAGSVAVAAIVRMRLGSKEGDFVRLDTWTRPLPQSVETLHWDYHVHSAIGIVTHWRSN